MQPAPQRNRSLASRSSGSAGREQRRQPHDPGGPRRHRFVAVNTMPGLLLFNRTTRVRIGDKLTAAWARGQPEIGQRRRGVAEDLYK